MAAEPTLEYFRALFPEFDAVPDDVVMLYLEVDEGDFRRGAWGRCYTSAVVNYAAHLLSLRLQRIASAGSTGVAAQVGVLQSGHEEGIAFAFARTASANDYFSTTPYGQAYAALQRSCLARARLSW